ncbi:MAG TPA: SDR family NAD(P)-dependent oxidoreductase, partial [Candidatus Deferrimicrobium sp.]|nr:SDR family NAD(P)-dependent oxidoreductase [Candidatus Deferrimicrobium sp.]
SHYRLLFEQLHKDGTLPHHIIHSWYLTAETAEIPLNRESFDNNQYDGFYSLLYMVKAFEKNVNDNTRITFLTDQVQEVTGDEIINPGKAPALGLLKVIPQEFPGIRCRHIDIILRGSSQLSDLLIAELTTESDDVTVAFRGSQRWVQFFDPFHLEASSQDTLLKENGIYLLTGGLGNIGLIIAEVLVKQVRARLILVGRSAFPAEKDWLAWLQTHDSFDPVSVKIKKLQQFREMDGKVLYFQADVAAEEEMKQVVLQAETTFGSQINGVIHAAGVTGGKSMQLITRLSVDDCLLQFHAKVYGTLVLGNLFKNHELDFCLLLSSISCVLGGLGFGAYAAANSFMDMFVKKYSRWSSLNWDGMDNETSAELFTRIFTLKKIDQLVISRGGNLQQGLERWIKLESLHGEAGLDNRQQHLTLFKTRPHLLNPYMAPRTGMEKSLTQIWQHLTGFDQIGIDDNFFDLGGDSLKAITLIARMHKELNVKVSLPELFQTPTIRTLAEMIASLAPLSNSNYAAIEPAEKKEYYPLSPAQKRLYVLHRMDEQSTGYNVSFYFLLVGELDKDKFEDVFRRLISRHEILKTSFHMINNEPVQRIWDEVEFKIETFGGGSRGVGAGASNVTSEMIRDFVRPFDLSGAPLLRVGLLKENDDRHILMVDMHHIVSDGVSINIVVNNFMSLYQGKDLPEFRLHYKDFSEWRCSQNQEESLKQQ